MAQVSDAEIYKEQYAHFRAMNDTLYKIPPLFTAVLGALWYFAANAADLWVSTAVFLFSSVLSVLFIGVMSRFRAAFNAYITNINSFDGNYAVSIKGKGAWPSTIKLVQIMLITAAVFSFTGALYKAPVAISWLGKSASTSLPTGQAPDGTTQNKS